MDPGHKARDDSAELAARGATMIDAVRAPCASEISTISFFRMASAKV